MNLNNYTQKSLEAVQSARDLAVASSHQQLEQIHLLLALLRQEGGLTPQLLRKMDITVESLEAAAASELRKLPAVRGSREADRFYISADMDAAFTSAEEQARAYRHTKMLYLPRQPLKQKLWGPVCGQLRRMGRVRSR